MAAQVGSQVNEQVVQRWVGPVRHLFKTGLKAGDFLSHLAQITRKRSLAHTGEALNKTDGWTFSKPTCRQPLKQSLALSPENLLIHVRVMHQLSTLLISSFQNRGLRQYLGVKDIALLLGRVPIETRPLVERHHMLQLVAWLMDDLEPRLRGARRAKAIRYNGMIKDFDDVPQVYAEIVAGFSNWRLK